jgi:hypothetical protein
MPVSPRNNLDPNSAPWGRWVDQNIDDINTALGRNDLDQLNNNKQLNSSVNVISTQISDLAKVVSDLQVAQDQLANTTAYLTSLRTSSVRVNSVNSGQIPADATVRYFDAVGGSLSLPVPTGKLLLSYGCGEMSLTPDTATSSINAYVAVSVSGGEPQNSARVFTVGQRIGSAASRSTVLDVPTTGEIVVQLKHGEYSIQFPVANNASYSVFLTITNMIE